MLEAHITLDTKQTALSHHELLNHQIRWPFQRLLFACNIWLSWPYFFLSASDPKVPHYFQLCVLYVFSCPASVATTLVEFITFHFPSPNHPFIELSAKSEQLELESILINSGSNSTAFLVGNYFILYMVQWKARGLRIKKSGIIF